MTLQIHKPAQSRASEPAKKLVLLCSSCGESFDLPVHKHCELPIRAVPVFRAVADAQPVPTHTCWRMAIEAAACILLFATIGAIYVVLP